MLKCGCVEPGGCGQSDADVSVRADGETGFGRGCCVGGERCYRGTEEWPFDHCA